MSATLVADNPNDNSILFARGVALFLSARFGTARGLFEQVMRNGPKFVGSERVFYFYGMCVMRLGEPDLARESLQALLLLDPADVDAQIGMAELTLHQGGPESALAMFGKTLRSLNEAEDAGRAFKAASAKAQAGMGSALLQLGRVDEALAALESSIEADPNQAQPYYSLSRALIQKGDHAQAKQAFDQFRRLSQPH